MKTPFTVEEFLRVFRNYNESVFPMQLVLSLISVIAVYLVFKPTSSSNKIISGVLAFLWLWMGVVYHLIFFTAINKAAYLFGAVFILQGILISIFGVFQNKLSFRFNPGIYGVTGIILIFFALIVYPVLGNAFGHRYPSSPTFGLPCPTTIFSLGLLLFIEKKFPVAILIIPCMWSVLGFTAVVNFGIVEDTGLLVSGLLSLPMLLARNKKYKRSMTQHSVQRA